ncbi:MAG: hypothetical protein HY737_03460 [Candidatus Omnitrophica bacterium]|nr:hypothetical protein [Candidatus Omnitrophota bacterium]
MFRRWGRLLAGGIAAGALIAGISDSLQQHVALDRALKASSAREAWMSAWLQRAAQRIIALNRRLDETTRDVAVLTARLEPSPSSDAPIVRQSSAIRSPTLELSPVTVRSLQRQVSGRVLQVNPTWGFIVVDLGREATRIGDQLRIVRNGRPIAAVEIERVSHTASAARILPGYEIAAITPDDMVEFQGSR